ncbi:MAG: ferrous iron transporter B [Deltaproteobacteria bacterium]|nr:ferrous iron transporter B [Deltaproteobacteria bacterium]
MTSNIHERGKQACPVRQMAILGNVCVGKTSLFGSLCSSGEHSVNIPGSTTEVKWGVLSAGSGGAPRSFRRRCADCGLHGSMGHRIFVNTSPCCDVAKMSATHLYDTPGSATLAANSEDEIVARDLMLSGQIDSVLLVADAKNLRRSLALALEVAELGLPMVFDLNMIDESESMGIEVDKVALARELGVPIGQTVATERRGIRRLAELILTPRVSTRQTRFSEAVDTALQRLEDTLQNPVLAARALGILLLAGDRAAETWVSEHLGEQVRREARTIVEEAQSASGTPLKKLMTDAFYAEAERIVERVLVSSARSPSLLVRFGALAQRPVSGVLIGLVVLILAYYWVGVFGATFVVDNLATHLFDGLLIPFFEKIVEPIPSAFVRDAIMDSDFGLLPTGLFLALGLVLPVLFCFYLFESILEDSGYLPRLAVLLDRIFRWLGLNGQSLIPLVLGFSCITMAVITTRMLPTRKERIILTLLLILGIPCAPLLAVMFILLGKMPWTAGAVVFGFVAVQILLAGYLSNKLIPGELPDLILELPKMRIPRPQVMLVKTWRRTWQFMREALPIFLVASFAVFLVDRLGGLALLENLARPVVQGLLGLPDQTVQVFIKTAIRRENGATELNLLRDQFDNVQLVVTMLVMTFLMPCINATIVIIKERGFKVSLLILTTVSIWAITAGAVVNLVCRGLGITFS